ncbi:hypothetical protein [Polaromonas sp. YR568]|uniref:hypothetical protein n=1 Tax=Polaromonas sp. YR568 TaxID=1855301 RepID=UPI00398BC20F
MSSIETLLTAFSDAYSWLKWEDIKAFANSNFTTALLGSMAGAYFGAHAAQTIAERSKARDELLKEIRATNAAIMQSFGICNTLLAFKGQHAKRLKDDFDANLGRVQEHERQLRAGELPPDARLKLVFDLMFLQPLDLPADTLQKHASEKITLNGRPSSLVAAVATACNSLRFSTEQRNQILAGYRQTNAEADPDFANRYLGLEITPRRVDRVYADTLKAIYDQTDDGIFFSHLLCSDLAVHGESLLVMYRKKGGTDAPNINKVDFEIAHTRGLMPNADNYPDWTTAFPQKKELDRASTANLAS